MAEVLLTMGALGLLYLVFGLAIEWRTRPAPEGDGWFALVPGACFLGLAVSLLASWIWG